MKFKLMALLLVAVITFTATGCVPGESDRPGIKGSKLVLAPVGEPDYSAYEGNEFQIGAWNPTPYRSVYPDKMFAHAKDAGINFLCDFRAARNPGSQFQKRVEEIERNQMRTFINLSGYTYETDVRGNEFLDSEYCMGINFWDEPGTSQFPGLETASKMFKEDHPDKISYINLLPNYASRGQLGADSFQEYIDTFLEEVPSVDLLSYDFYPLVGQMSGGEVLSHSVWQLWLYSLEVMATAAKSVDKDLWVFIQNMSFGVNHRSPQSTADITFQNYINMCFGVKAIQYFCLTTPTLGGEFSEWDLAMLDRDMNPTANFDYVKQANQELNTFSYVYEQFAWENVMPIYGSLDNALNTGAFDMLENPLMSSKYVEASADFSVLIGKFVDDNGYNGYMLANYSDPLDFQDANLTMNFNANRLLVFANGTKEVVEISDGVYECNLIEGEGRFVIPFNA